MAKKKKEKLKKVYEARIFEMSAEQVKKYEKWRKKLPKEYFGAAGGGEHFIFTTTGIGMGMSVKYGDHEIDLTEYEYW